MSRQTVRRILAGTWDDVFRCRETTLDRWAERLKAEWDEGCRNGAELWRRLRDAGYGGSQRVVTEWATRKRRALKALLEKPGAVTTVPPARIIAKLLTSKRDCQSAEGLSVRVAVETASPEIMAARNLLDRFRTMVAAKKTDDLTPGFGTRWAANSRPSPPASGTTRPLCGLPSSSLGPTDKRRGR